MRLSFSQGCQGQNILLRYLRDFINNYIAILLLTNKHKHVLWLLEMIGKLKQVGIYAIITARLITIIIKIRQQNQNMIDYRSKLLGYSSRPTQRADEWTLINQHKSLQEEKAKIQEQRLEEEKKRQLAQILQMQIREKNSKEMVLRNEEQYYAGISERQVREAREENELKRRMHIQKRRDMETHNKGLFNDIVESKIREPVYPTPTSIDIGTSTQIQRRMMVNNQRKGMIDELDRQIHQKQREKIQSKMDQYKIDQANLSYQFNRFDARDKSLHSRHFGQNPYVYQHYQQIKQQQKERQREFQRTQIEEAGRRKQEEQMNKINEKNMNKKYLTTKMKEVLEEQMKIKDYQRYQEDRVNPEELSYGTIGRMLSQKRHQHNKQEYFDDLKRQIQEKQKRKEAEKFMNEEEYKINLNQLNRAIEGNYATKNYVDRSIHALSDSHKVNVSMIDAHLESRPQAEIARRNLEEIKARREKLSLSMMDRPSANNF